MKGMIWLPSTLFLLVAAHLRRDLASDLKDLSLRYSTDTKNSTFVEVKASKLSDASDISNVQVSKIDFSNVSNVSNVSRIEDKSGVVAAEHDCSLPPGSRWSRRAAACGRAELLAKGQHTDRLQNPAKLRRFRIGGG